MNKSDIVLTLADHLISCTFFGPLVVMYWRGTWNLLDVYVMPSDPKLSAWISLAVGNVGMLSLAFLGPVFKRKFPKENPWIWFFVYHLYTYIAGFLSVNQWRGMWHVLDEYTGKGPQSFTVCIIVAWIFLAAIRCSKMCFAPPLLVAMDTDSSFFEFSTRFQTEPGLTERYVWDSILTICVIGNGVVTFWRSGWTLLNHFLLPDDQVMSAFMCLSFGYTILVFCGILQLPLNILYKTLAKKGYHTFCLALAENTLYIIANPAVVCLWRGVWFSCDLHLFPQNKTGSSALTHIGAYVILSIFLNANSLLVKGCVMDGEASADDGILFINDFLRYFKKIRKSRCSSKSKTSRDIFTVFSIKTQESIVKR